MHINNENKETWIVGGASKELLDNTILNAEGEYSIKFTKPENRFCFKSKLQQQKNSYLFANTVKRCQFKAKHSKLIHI